MSEPLSDLRSRLPRLGRVRDMIGGRKLWLGVVAVIALLALYYPVGMIWVHTIDDAPAFFADTDVSPKESRAIAMAAALIEREVEDHGWVPNDPFFLPSGALDNMPNFQLGIQSGLARFALEMRDQLGRTRGSSQVDSDLERAASLLQYSGKVWVWDPRVSLFPTATSEAQYRAAREALLAYNRRLANGQATFDRRADNLMATIERFTADLGSASANIEERINERAPILFDFVSDDIFYRTKGLCYSYYLLLRELGRDYQDVLADRRLEAAWAQTLHTLEEAAVLQPIVVVSGDPASQILPSHLASQGFYVLRARTQLREITNILLK
ncbi:MAG: DUF2333 family protein [Alphaproteobacteria bacterium]|nr:DUF2333 family protein [Alphaproteobacteria bacterium]